MSNMKSLSLIVAPTASSLSPKLRRRQNLIERLEEQHQLAKDPNFTITVRRWIKDTEGVKQPIEIKKRIKPWWRKDATGSLYMILKSGLKRLVQGDDSHLCRDARQSRRRNSDPVSRC